MSDIGQDRICPRCEYPLAGDVQVRCPECGEVVTPICAVRPRLALRLSAYGGIILASFLLGWFTCAAGSLEVLRPMPFPHVIVGWSTPRAIYPLSGCSAAVLSALIAMPVARGSARLPVWSSWIISALVAGAAIWCVHGIQPSLTYNTRFFTVSSVMVSLVTGAATAFLWFRSTRIRSYGNAAMACAAASLWQAGYAFPYLGEML